MKRKNVQDSERSWENAAETSTLQSDEKRRKGNDGKKTMYDTFKYYIAKTIPSTEWIFSMGSVSNGHTKRTKTRRRGHRATYRPSVPAHEDKDDFTFSASTTTAATKDDAFFAKENETPRSSVIENLNFDALGERKETSRSLPEIVPLSFRPAPPQSSGRRRSRNTDSAPNDPSHRRSRRQRSGSSHIMDPRTPSRTPKREARRSRTFDDVVLQSSKVDIDDTKDEESSEEEESSDEESEEETVSPDHKFYYQKRPLEKVKYNVLKRALSRRGLSPAGKKLELIRRMRESMAAEYLAKKACSEGQST